MRRLRVRPTCPRPQHAQGEAHGPATPHCSRPPAGSPHSKSVAEGARVSHNFLGTLKKVVAIILGSTYRFCFSFLSLARVSARVHALMRVCVRACVRVCVLGASEKKKRRKRERERERSSATNIGSSRRNEERTTTAGNKKRGKRGRS